MKKPEDKSRTGMKVVLTIIAITLVFGAQAANRNSSTVTEGGEPVTIKPEIKTNLVNENVISDSGKSDGKPAVSVAKVLIEDATDEVIQIEPWMLNANHEFWSGYTPEKADDEEEIEIESWMLDVSGWQ